MKRLTTQLICLLISFTGYAQGAYPVKYSMPKAIETKAGACFNMTINFTVTEPWYIYAPTGNNAAQGMIETNVIYQLPKGITRKGKMQLPKLHFKGGFEVYEGNGIVMSQEFEVHKDVLPGTYKIHAKVAYQSCNEKTCLPPMMDEVEIALIVKADDCAFTTSSDILVLSDIEGECTAFKKLMLKHGVLDKDNKWIFGTNHLVIVGDLFDRGNEVMEYLWLLHKMDIEARKSGGYVHVILGNHDIMNMSGDLRYVQPKYLAEAGKSPKAYMALFSKDTELGKWLRTKNIMEKINDRVFVHGGISAAVNKTGMSIAEINAACRPYYDNTNVPDSLKVFFSGNTSPFWYRGYFMEPMASMAQVDSTLKLFDAKQIVVGHTIVPHIQSLYEGKVLAVDVNHHEGINEAVLLKSADRVLTEKNFYLISLLDRYPKIKALLPLAVGQSADLSELKFADAEVKLLKGKLLKVYDGNVKQIDVLINEDLRPSGAYQLYAGLDNRNLWLKAWQEYFKGVNYIIDQYGLNKKMRYPGIDSAGHKVKQEDYQDRIKAGALFYENPLAVALVLMKLNNRDEAARHEPLEAGENSMAKHLVDSVDFAKYKYSAIVVPGDGPQSYIPLAQSSIKRCELAAERFKNGLAPFIILTGGYCHPFQTPYAEAVEMKKHLVRKLGVPGSVIIIDPHARHTTTNFRNPGRYLITYGFPLDKASLFVTSADHVEYIMNPKFEKRNMDELGYLPYKSLKRISDNEISFFTVQEVLHRDPIDPLDP